jgi:hypothetical protein
MDSILRRKLKNPFLRSRKGREKLNKQRNYCFNSICTSFPFARFAAWRENDLPGSGLSGLGS